MTSFPHYFEATGQRNETFIIHSAETYTQCTRHFDAFNEE